MARHRGPVPASDNSRRLHGILHRAYTRGGISLQGDYARQQPVFIAMAASLNLITTELPGGTFGRRWYITSKGLRWLNEGN